MKKNIQNKYIITLCLFVIVFLATMCYMLYKIHDLTEYYGYDSLNNRLENAKSDEEYCNSCMINTLMYDEDYEPQFDRFWEFANIEDCYMRALILKRACNAGETDKQAELDKCLEQIASYAQNTNSSYFRNYANAYCEAIKSE